ncbi:hypothetical protein CGCSCA1_v002145 [Colletotrichum siamense]|nr:hypothetical protein CGCSCA1_v002145 [Colletotrichum siamense]
MSFSGEPPCPLVVFGSGSFGDRLIANFRNVTLLVITCTAACFGPSLRCQNVPFAHRDVIVDAVQAPVDVQ